MEIKQLITFKTAADNLNFTKTAQILNFAQSSVTAQIKALEADLGIQLFERLGKRVKLTEAGQQFKQYAEKMIMLTEEVKMVVNEDQQLTSTLVIGAQESLCTYRLPPILKKFKADFPHVKVTFKPSHSDKNSRAELLEGNLDIAFIMDTPKQSGFLQIESLIKEELKLIVSTNHHLLSKSYVSLQDLEHETLLLTESGCSYRNILEKAFLLSDTNPLNKIEFVSIEAIKQCVIAGIGVALVPSMVVEKDIKAGTIRELNWEDTTSPIYTQLAWHKDKSLTPPLEAFINITRQVFNN